MLDKLTELNGRRAQGNAELEQLSIPIQAAPHLTDEQVVAASNAIYQSLMNSPPERVRTILQGFIIEIRAQREGKQVHGLIKYGLPPFESAPSGLPLGWSPLGAHSYRQAFTVPFSYEKSRST